MSAEILPLDIAAPAPRRERRHPRLRLPVEARIGGRAFPAADWSVAGIALLGVDFAAKSGDTVELELALPLRGCSVGATVRARVCYHDRFRRRAGLEFLDLAPPQLAMLQFVVDEHLAGQILDVDGVLEFAARRTEGGLPRVSDAGASSPAPRVRQIAGRALGLGLALSIGLGAVTLLAAGFYRHFFVFEAASAEVAVPTTAMAAPAAGVLGDLARGNEVARGDTLFALRPAEGGPEIRVASPCDCRIVAREAGDGASLAAGAAVMSLARRDATAFVRARIPFAALARVYDGAAATLTYADGVETRVDTTTFHFPARGLPPGPFAELQLPPGRELSADAVGQPVALSFDAFRLFGWLR